MAGTIVSGCTSRKCQELEVQRLGNRNVPYRCCDVDRADIADIFDTTFRPPDSCFLLDESHSLAGLDGRKGLRMFGDETLFYGRVMRTFVNTRMLNCAVEKFLTEILAVKEANGDVVGTWPLLGSVFSLRVYDRRWDFSNPD